jgi:hypothetical protein
VTSDLTFYVKKINEIGSFIQKLLNGTQAERSTPAFDMYSWDCDQTDTSGLR